MKSATEGPYADPKARRIVDHDHETLNEQGPDEHLLLFFRNLSPGPKTELALEIMRGMGRRTGRGPPEFATEQLMLARYGVLLRRRTILMTGLIDHYLAVKADDELRKVRFSGSLSPWREARAIWLELRSNELSPTMIANLKRYRGKRGRE